MARVFLVLAGTLLGVILAEWACRAFWPCEIHGYAYEPPQKALFRHDPDLGWVGRPGAAGTFAGTDFSVTVRLDSLGNRNSVPPHRDGARNTLLVGDSFPWGWGVEMEDAVGAAMMRVDPSVHVYSLAAPGYGPDQSLLSLERFLEDAPGTFDSCVSFVFVGNDFDDISAVRRYGMAKPQFRLDGAGVLSLQNVPVSDADGAFFDEERSLDTLPYLDLGIWNRFHLFNRLVTRPRIRRTRSLMDSRRSHRADPVVDPALRERRQAEARSLMGAILARMDQRLRDAGIRHVAVVLYETAPDPRLEFMRQFLDSRAIPHVALGRDETSWRSRYLCCDPHLNAHGHATLAREVLHLLEDG